MVRWLGITIWQRHQHERPQIVAVWRDPGLDDDQLERLFYAQVRSHVEKHLRTIKWNEWRPYDMSLYHMSIYEAFRRLDRDTQQLVNLLLRRRLDDESSSRGGEEGGEGEFRYWDLVVFQEDVPRGGGRGAVNNNTPADLHPSCRRRWTCPWRRRECFMSEFRLVLRRVRTGAGNI